MDGVEGYFDHHDVPGSNEIGPVLHDEEVCLPLSLAQHKSPHSHVIDHMQTLDGLQLDICGQMSSPLAGPINTTGCAMTMRPLQVFATRTVTCVGQIIGIVVADTEAHAREAARAVAIDYQELPALVSIDDAIEAGSFYEVRPPALCHRVIKMLHPWLSSTGKDAVCLVALLPSSPGCLCLGRAAGQALENCQILRLP